MKYTDIETQSTGYVSSSYHYFTEVTFKENGKLMRMRLCIPSDLYQPSALPKYACLEIMRQLRQRVESGQIRFHEFDRDGNKRWEGLKYFDQDAILNMVKDWPL